MPTAFLVGDRVFSHRTLSLSLSLWKLSGLGCQEGCEMIERARGTEAEPKQMAPLSFS